MCIGIDVGDRGSAYCVREMVSQKIVAEGVVATTPTALLDHFRELKAQRIVLETGTHSRWMTELLRLMGQEVIVGNSRKLKLITENTQKSDTVDARLLSKLGCVSADWLHPVYQRAQETHNDLLVVRARQRLVETRTMLINYVRGVVKSYGCRVKQCDAAAFVKVAHEALPEALRPALSGILETLEEVNEQIYAYECQIEHLCQTKYQEEIERLKQVKGVGSITALAYRLTIEDAERFQRSCFIGCG
jgi:transposase